MNAAVTISYLYDPLCGWCYGAMPALNTLGAQADFNLSLSPSGMFSGPGARPMDASFADYLYDRFARDVTDLRLCVRPDG